MKTNTPAHILIWITSLLSPLFGCEDCMRQYIFPKWIEITDTMSFKVQDNFLIFDTNAGVAKHPILEYDEENNRYFVDKEQPIDISELLKGDFEKVNLEDNDS